MKKEMYGYFREQIRKSRFNTPMELAMLNSFVSHLSDNKTENENSKKINPIEIGDLVKKRFPDISWLVKDLVPSDGIVLISGYPGSFKTWLMMQMALAIASGEKFLDEFETTQKNILYVDEENGERIFRKRIKQLIGNYDGAIFLNALQDFKIDKDSDELLQYCLCNNISVVMLDSFVRIHSKDENSSTEINKIYDKFKKLKNNGICVIISHHNRKSGNQNGGTGDEIRGSSDILAFLDCHLSISCNKKKRTITVKQTKLREQEERKPFLVKYSDVDEKIIFSFGGDVEESTVSKVEQTKDFVVEYLKENSEIYGKDIIDKIKNAKNIEIGSSSLKSAIKELFEENLITAVKVNGNNSLYKLKG